jgi:hypothetical protein
MTRDEFQYLLDGHGADPACWPAELRAAADRLIAGDVSAQAAWQAARRMDDLLAGHLGAAERDADSAGARVLAALARPLPPQKRRLWNYLPSVLLNAEFAPAWPRVAALAGCAVLGFVVGITGIDRRLERPRVQLAQSSASDISSLASEPEPLTGLRP